MRLRRMHCVAYVTALTVAALIAPTLPACAAAAKTKAKGRVVAAPAAQPAPTATSAGPIDTQARHALIIEAETGAVLLDKGADERIPPASMSKLMTAYVVFGLLKSGQAKLIDQLPVSEAAWRTGGSKMFVPLGGRVSIDDLLQGMIVQSGNDACVVLAEGLAGSQQAFVDLMNRKAKEIGLLHSHFADVDGLPDPNHYMTARDLATLALHTIHDFPEYYHYFDEKEFTFNNIKQGNRNPLLYANIGADGLKTGHTEEAGYSLLASVHRGDRRIILVLNGLPTSRARAQEGERLAEWAFREYNDYQLFKAGDQVENADVWLGDQAKVPLTVAHNVVVTLSRQARKAMSVKASFDGPVPAPISKGEEIGKVVISAPDTPQVEVPLHAAAGVDRLGPLGRAAMIAARLIWGDRH